MKLMRFIAKGTSAFPVDMLRYDACWPNDGESATNIILSGKPNLRRAADGNIVIWIVSLTSIGTPTVERWSSFGWSISDIKKGL
jgi:hypothetical protein